MSAPRLQLDFARPPRRATRTGVLLLACALAYAGHVGARYGSLQTDAPAARAAAAPAAAVRHNAELLAAREVVRQLALPWSALVQALEGAALPEVALLAAQPDAGRGEIQLQGEALTEPALFEYLRRLRAAGLARVHLVAHQHAGEDTTKVRFTVRARLGAP